MGFQTPLYELSEYLKWTTSGKIQLPDFQRGYKWEDERIRQLLVTILRGHPLGVVMLLKTGKDQIRFKPRPSKARRCRLAPPAILLLDGQQRLTSLTQALTGDGVVATMDSRGKMIARRYYINIETALQGEDRIDEAVFSVPATGSSARTSARTSSGTYRRRKRSVSTVVPVPPAVRPADAATWLFELDDNATLHPVPRQVIASANTYNIPAIELDESPARPQSPRSSRRSTPAGSRSTSSSC